MSRQAPSLIRSALRPENATLTIASFGISPAKLPPRHRVIEVLPNIDVLEFLAPFDLDLVVSIHNEMAVSAAKFVSRALHANLVCLINEPPPEGASARREYARRSCGDFNGFASLSFAEAWGFEGVVVDTEESLDALLGDAAAAPFCWTPEPQ